MTARAALRWITASGAFVAAAICVAISIGVASADGRRGSVIFGVAGLALLVVGLVFSSGTYPVAVSAIAVAFAFALAGQHVSRVAVVAMTAALLLVDQLTAWSFDAATGAIERGSERGRRVLRIAGIAVGGGALAALVLGGGELPVPGDVAAEAIGIAAALGVLGLAAGRRWER